MLLRLLTSLWQQPAQLLRFTQLFFVLGVAMWVAAGAFWLLKQPRFDVQVLSVYGLRGAADLQHIDAALLQNQLAGAHKGNVFTTPLEPLRQALKQQPWVREVMIQRLYPNELRVTVEAHQVLARLNQDQWVNTFGETFYVDYEGVAPVLLAAPENALQVAQRLLSLNSWLSPLKLSVSQLHYNERRAWQAKLDNGLVLELGRDDMQPSMQQRTEKWVMAWAAISSKAPKAGKIDLRYDNGFAIETTKAQE